MQRHVLDGLICKIQMWVFDSVGYYNKLHQDSNPFKLTTAVIESSGQERERQRERERVERRDRERDREIRTKEKRRVKVNALSH